MEKLNREPTIHELSTYSGYSRDSLKSLMDCNFTTIPYDVQIENLSEEEFESIYPLIDQNEDFTLTIDDILPNNDQNYDLFSQMEITFIKKIIDELLNTLSEREREIIYLRFGFKDGTPKTLEEIGKIFGITRERVRQIEAKIIKKFKHPSKRKYLK